MPESWNSIRKSEARALQQSREITKEIARLASHTGATMGRHSRVRPLCVFPGLLNTLDRKTLNPLYFNFMTEMITWFRERFPPSELRDGAVTGLGIPSEGLDLQSAPGFPMNPMGYPPARYDKPPIQISDPRHRQIMEGLLESVLHKWRPTSSAKISKVSSSGFVYFNKLPSYKSELISYTLSKRDAFIESFLTDPRRCMNEFHTIPAYSIGRRHQADVFGKDREATSLREALGLDSGRSIANKTISQPKGKIQFEAQRERIVYAGPGGMNYLATLVLNGFRDDYLSRYEFTYKVRGPQDFESKIAQRYLVGVDVKQFDQNYSEDFAEAIFNRMNVLIREDLVKALRKLWTCPVYCPPPSFSREETPGLWIGNPFNPEEDPINLGLPSGVAYNPDAGKWYGTFLLLCVLDDLYHDVLEVGIDSILKGEHSEYGLLNASDDAVLLIKSKAKAEELRARLDSGQASKYLIFELEQPITYLGMVPRISTAGAQYDVLRNTVNYLKNRWIPEAGIESPLRRYWALGWLVKNEEFAAQEGIPEIQEFEAHLVKKYLNCDLISVVRACAAENQIALASESDSLFLQNPDTIYYRGIEPSAELIERVFVTFSPDRQKEMIFNLLQSEAT